MRNPKALTYAFHPTQRTIDFAGTPDFDVRNLAGILHPSGVLVYFPGKAGLGLDLLRTSGTVVALQYNTASFDASDPLICLYEDGTAPLPAGAATASLQQAGNASLAALASALAGATGRPYASDTASTPLVQGAGTLIGYDLFNNASLARVVSLYDSAAAPSASASPILTMTLGGGDGRALGLSVGVPFASGLWAAVSARGSSPAPAVGDVTGSIIA